MIWGVLAAVVAALSVVIFLLVRPLWRGAAEGTSTKEKGGISRRRRLWAIALTLALPALAGLLYWQLGGFRALRPAATSPDAAHALDPQQIQAMVARLAEKLQQNPNDGAGWLMLGRSYVTLKRFPEAAAAYGRASQLLPPSADFYADYADVLAMAQGKRLTGEPEKLIARALEIDPRHVKALALSGSAAFERGDYEAAAREWEKILAIVPADSPVAQRIGNSIADAKRRMGAS